jgi:hypothetical protein
MSVILLLTDREDKRLGALRTLAEIGALDDLITGRSSGDSRRRSRIYRSRGVARRTSTVRHSMRSIFRVVLVKNFLTITDNQDFNKPELL